MNSCTAGFNVTAVAKLNFVNNKEQELIFSYWHEHFVKVVELEKFPTNV